MTEKPPIPPALWDRILAFVRAGATGQIVLNIHRGHVQTVSINEQIRDEPPIEPLPARQPDRRW